MIYDIETYPNIFTLAAKDPATGSRYLFEISWRRNQFEQMMNFLAYLRSEGRSMIGFNNLGFDYPVVHAVIDQGLGVKGAYEKAISIIRSQDRFGHVIWESDHFIPQIDLYKIHHFDNQSKATSLKALEFAMRMKSVEDLPFKPGRFLHGSEMDKLIFYNHHDVDATELFWRKSQDQIAFRQQLTEQLGVNMMNFNDTKIGKQYFILELEKAGVPCYTRASGKREPRQTPRPFIRLADVILPYVQFDRPEFQRVLDYLRGTTITDTKKAPELSGVKAVLDGFQFDFGTGGIHGSLEWHIAEADDEYVIEDIDVSSYYPNLAIANRLYPAHLSEVFSDIYKQVYDRRKQTAKNSAENAMLKLALNGVYGDSGSEYGPFFDTQYTMSITINGQLLLCMLAEKLIGQVQLLQINTDGITIRYPRHLRDWVKSVCKWWEGLTKLELESVDYQKMWIRDVNSYVALKMDGKRKRIGAFAYETALENPTTRELGWHKDHSALVVPKAAEAFLVHGTPIKQYVESHTDIFDFMLRARATGSSRLELVDYHGNITPSGKLARYFVSHVGHDLIKVMPPLKGKTQERRIAECAGWKVLLANNIDTVNPDDIFYDWYIKEAEKLVAPFFK